ncbi:SDR family NAD(P)-dependent oxidoreductase [Allopusillimonas ginsengisoli]|uniref:SDR family NAD(P)-dependent oxidoreductase n=1 Tax=Allopusillimonas ginsengisoli TaxID=453575 RepID=UPI0039C26B19
MTDTLSAEMLARLAQGKTFQDLVNKVVFITGAASGIGLAMARAFAACEARLALLDIDALSLERAVASLRAEFPEVQVHTWAAGVTDEAAVNQAFSAAHAVFGSIDVLLNNAGISMNAPTLSLTGEQWRKAMDVNVNGVFYCAQAAGRYMSEQGQGVILNMSSMYGAIAAPERAAYCTSKAAVAMLTKVLAIEWGKLGIRVNAIAPGYVRTALVDDLVKAGRMDLDALTRRTPTGRLGEPHEIATLALFLASEHASFINGHAVVADGGWSAYSYI